MGPMKKLANLFAVPLCLCLFLTACGPSATDESASTGDAEPAAVETFKVALLTPGPVSDAGWNALAYKGLMDIQEEFGAEVRHVETTSPQEFPTYFRNFAEDGFDLVIGHGFEYQDAAAEVSADYPDTVFITTSGTTVRPNVAPIVFCLEEATYLMGIVAAHLSESGKVALLGGLKIPSIESSFDTFEMGAKTVNPDITVVRSFVGGWEDVVKANEATRALINEGVDVIFHNADAAGRGMFQAVREASTPERPIYCYGSNANQNDLAPEHCLGSAVIHPDAFTMVARWVHEGTFDPKITVLDMKNDAISVEWNPSLADRIPAEALEQFEAARQQILDGELVIPIKFLQDRPS